MPLWYGAILGAVLIIAAFLAVRTIYVIAYQAAANMEVDGLNVTLPSLPNLPFFGGSDASDLPSDAEPGPVQPRGVQYSERVTVLVLGIDQRNNEHGPWRTDTMILLSADPTTKSAVMLSIPRDLWVEIPGIENADGSPVIDRINTANYLGDVRDYPGGGPALAMRTVEYNLGIRVDYYVLVNFTAFENLIDTIGGIDVVVPQDIYDPQYPDGSYGYSPFSIEAGPQHLDGRTALKYARTRHTFGSDFDRAERQQQVILAIRDKVTRFDMLPTLLVRAPELFANFRGSVKSDLSLEQMVGLAQLAQGVNGDDIRSGVIDARYTSDYVTPDGQQVLVPQRERIRTLIDELFYARATPDPDSPSDEQANIAEERATIAVYNGGAAVGMAGQAKTYLEARGFKVVEAGNADRFDYAHTQIVDYAGKPYTTRALAQLFAIPQGAILSGAEPNHPVNIVIILGQDFVLPEDEGG
jgi:LCP family protein required for cell wall assembly